MCRKITWAQLILNLAFTNQTYIFVFWQFDVTWSLFHSATGGADSDAHGSEEGTPVDDKEGAQHFGAGKLLLCISLSFVYLIFIFCMWKLSSNLFMLCRLNKIISK